MRKETGGPAFPVGEIVQRDERGYLHGPTISSAGLTLRDYFAAKAMQGDLSHEAISTTSSDVVMESLANHYYRVADAMLKVRNQ